MAEALGIPGGPALAAVLGAIAIGVGIRPAVQGLSRSFLSSLDLSGAPPAARGIAISLGTVGFTAQGARRFPDASGRVPGAPLHRPTSPGVRPVR